MTPAQSTNEAIGRPAEFWLHYLRLNKHSIVEARYRYMSLEIKQTSFVGILIFHNILHRTAQMAISETWKTRNLDRCNFWFIFVSQPISHSSMSWLLTTQASWYWKSTAASAQASRTLLYPNIMNNPSVTKIGSWSESEAQKNTLTTKEPRAPHRMTTQYVIFYYCSNSLL